VDRDVVERARGGDEAAYEDLAAATARRLYLIAHRILRDSDAAEDATQQALVTIWRELPRLRDADRFEAWSYRLVVRAAVAEAKRGRSRRKVAELGGTGAQVVTPDASTQVATRDALERAFQKLTPEHRAVVVLRYYADLPIKEIAVVLGVPYGTVGSRLHRAVQDLRSVLEADEPRRPPGSWTGSEDALWIRGRPT
jgi:RNA polymerase sigma-70 factor, ECF subfamily